MGEITQEMKTEIKQVTAVGQSIMEDFRYGQAEFMRMASDIPQDVSMEYQGPKVAHQVALERKAQDAKWGPQHHDPLVWLMILMEEVGEFAEEIEFLPGDDQALYGLRNNIVINGHEAQRWLQTVYEPDGGLEPV